MYLRDTLLRLATGETYRPLWSGDMLDELARGLTEAIGPHTSERIVVNTASAFPDACVTGHDQLVAAMRNEAKDRHVLAAAVRANASAIVTPLHAAAAGWLTSSARQPRGRCTDVAASALSDLVVGQQRCAPTSPGRPPTDPRDPFVV